MSRHAPERSRSLYALLMFLTIGAGLATRYGRSLLPAGLSGYLGDALWAAMVFFLSAMAFPNAPTRKLAVGATLFAFAIEMTQLYHAPWIEALRHTLPGGLILGYDFDGRDLLYYLLGICLAAMLDRRLYAFQEEPKVRPKDRSIEGRLK